MNDLLKMKLHTIWYRTAEDVHVWYVKTTLPQAPAAEPKADAKGKGKGGAADKKPAAEVNIQNIYTSKCIVQLLIYLNILS